MGWGNVTQQAVSRNGLATGPGTFFPAPEARKAGKSADDFLFS